MPRARSLFIPRLFAANTRTVWKITEKCEDNGIVVLWEKPKMHFLSSRHLCMLHCEEGWIRACIFPGTFSPSIPMYTHVLSSWARLSGWINRARSIKTAYSWKFREAIYLFSFFVFLGYERCFNVCGSKRGNVSILRICEWSCEIFQSILLEEASSQVSSHNLLYLSLFLSSFFSLFQI